VKVGETLEVTIGGMKVADAKIVEVDHKKNTVEIVVPATRAVMGFKTQLDVPPTPVAPEVQHEVVEVERTAPVEQTSEQTTPPVTDKPETTVTEQTESAQSETAQSLSTDTGPVATNEEQNASPDA
jgi:hypothetical protein